jgi:hypothetical protein
MMTWVLQMTARAAVTALQRLLTLAAGGRTHAKQHQTAVRPYDRLGHERPRFAVQRS